MLENCAKWLARGNLRHLFTISSSHTIGNSQTSMLLEGRAKTSSSPPIHCACVGRHQCNRCRSMHLTGVLHHLSGIPVWPLLVASFRILCLFLFTASGHSWKPWCQSLKTELKVNTNARSSVSTYAHVYTVFSQSGTKYFIGRLLYDGGYSTVAAPIFVTVTQWYQRWWA